MSKLTQKILDDSIEEVLEEAERRKQTMAGNRGIRRPVRMPSPDILKSLRKGKV